MYVQKSSERHTCSPSAGPWHCAGPPGAGPAAQQFETNRYGEREHVPDFMHKDGVYYRFITDQVGSVRLVVNANTGEVAQRIDYDSFGVVLNDTNPGFQPFGFAGGLYDPGTGLVRFGARDYDPEVGRWTNKDPIRWEGGQANLYVYVGGDPVNRTDASGLGYDKKCLLLEASCARACHACASSLNSAMCVPCVVCAAGYGLACGAGDGDSSEGAPPPSPTEGCEGQGSDPNYPPPPPTPVPPAPWCGPDVDC